MRLIDADALIRFIDVGHLRNPTELCLSELDVVNLLRNAPTIENEPVFLTSLTTVTDTPPVEFVPVVRCKDCLHRRELNKYEKQLYLSECVGCTRHSVSYHDAIMMGDDFCSYGERRDSDG